MKQVFVAFAFAIIGSLATATTEIENFEDLTIAEICSYVPAGTSFLRPNSCSSWVKCASESNQHEEGTCVFGLYYDKELGVCAEKENISCPYRETSLLGNLCADKNNGVFVADPNSCSGYIMCESRRELFGTCPNGLVFNPELGSCVYKQDYKCPEEPQKVASPICRSFQNKTIIADENDCTKFHVCIDGALEERECETKFAYDHLKGSCIPHEEVECFETAVLPEPENTFCLNATGYPRSGYIRDDESCAKYYFCARPINGKHDTEPKHMECSYGQYFDEEKLSCRDRLHVKCTLDRCTGTSLTYVNVAGDCKRYARCMNGVSVSYGACPNDYYFDERTQGCTPQKLNYIACSA